MPVKQTKSPNAQKPAESKAPSAKPKEALPERVLRRMLEGMGAVVDRGLGRAIESKSGLTTSMIVDRMKHLIDERLRDEGRQGLVAPHVMKLKIEWGTHSQAPVDVIEDLEHEILAAAIDHINDHRYRTLAPVKVETQVDIFVTGIVVDPTFGEFEEDLRKKDEAKRLGAQGKTGPPTIDSIQIPDVTIVARAALPQSSVDVALMLKPGGKRLGVGRGTDNELCLRDTSVSKIHAALMLNREGTLLVADTGSTNGTFINGRRIAYGEARQVEEGDVVAFGNIEVRFRRQNS